MVLCLPLPSREPYPEAGNGEWIQQEMSEREEQKGGSQELQKQKGRG
jgi:hypothetical protein